MSVAFSEGWREGWKRENKKAIRTGIEKLVKDPPALIQAISSRHILILGGVLLRLNQQHHLGLLVPRVLYLGEEIFEVKRHLARVLGDLLGEGRREGGREGGREDEGLTKHNRASLPCRTPQKPKLDYFPIKPHTWKE
jgi:hypothetical protein